MAEAEHPVAGDQRLDLLCVRRDQANANPVAQLGQLDRLEHFGKQAPGIEGEDIDLGAGLGDGVKDRLILEPEAGRERDAALDPPPHLADSIGQALDPW